MTGYKMNFATKTLTITKAFAELAMRPNTEEANVLAQMHSLFPDLKIAYKAHYCNKPHPYKGLTYKKMETYISLHENAAELMEAFETVKAIAVTQLNPHNFVCKWFLQQFPDYREIPKMRNGKIVAIVAITLPEATTEETAMNLKFAA